MGEVIALNEIYPSWDVHSSFLKYHRNSALDLDALQSSHPVQLECSNDSEEAIAQSLSVELFALVAHMLTRLGCHLDSDAISYEKGSAVLKMLSDVIGQDTFLKGV